MGKQCQISRRSNQPILKEVFFGRTDAEAEAPIPWPPDAKTYSLEKDSERTIEGRRRRGRQRMRRLDGITD